VRTSKKTSFDAGTYWKTRVVSGADLSVVGHRSMGPGYNRHIYERRLELLELMLERHVGRSVQDLRVLDIGCGSGFYTSYWQARGVGHYVGVDISPAAVQHLASKFPDYRFINHDIADPASEVLSEAGAFDVITIFDVFYHIIDDGQFAKAVQVVASMASPGARVLVMDQLFSRRYQLSHHVVYRESAQYLRTFADHALQLVDRELLFHYLVPPISGSRVIDVLGAGIFKAMGGLLRLSGPLEARTAELLRRRDGKLRDRGKRVQNSEFLVFRRGGD
jgi:SAM-dependent methyltransferase